MGNRGPPMNVAPTNFGQIQNGSSPAKGQQYVTQTASTRYMSSSSQNYVDNDAPRIEQAQMLDLENSDAVMGDFMNLNNQLDDNSINDQEGGAEDN